MKKLLPLAALLILTFACSQKASESDLPSDAAGSVESVAGDQVESESVQSSANSSDPCEQFISDYENWTNRYIQILRQYKQDPTDMSAIEKFTEMTNEAAAWSERTPDCSEPEHIERLTAIAQRLMDAAM